MPDEPLKVKFGGREVPAVRVNVTSSNEVFNSYLLDDGATLRLKSVVTEILRLEGVRDNTGLPIYLVKSQVVMNVQP